MASIIRGVQQVGLTAGGPTQDFQHSAFSAAQPVKAGLFFMAPSTALGTALDHARMSIGFTDGTNHRCISTRCRDAQAAASDTVRQGFTNQLAWIYAASTTNAASAMAFSSMSNDKIVGTYGTLMPAAWYVNALLFGGSDVEAFVGDLTANTSDGGTTVVDSSSHPGFTFGWDLIFLITRGTAFNGSSSAHSIFSFGIAIWDGSAISQGCASFSNQDNVGTEVSSAELDDNRCARQHVMPSNTGDGYEITARNSSGGFTLTTRGANALTTVIGFMALRLGGIQGIKLFSRDTLTGTGSDSWTDAGHSPQFMLSLSTSCTAMNTLSSGAADACIGIGAACGDSGAHEEFSSAIMADDGAGTSDTRCVTHNVFHHIPDQVGANPTTADLTSIQINGAMLNYSAVLGTARKQLILSVGRNKIELEPRVLGEAAQSIAMGTKLGVTSSVLGGAVDSTAVGAVRRLEGSVGGEAADLVGVGRSRAVDAAGVGEAAGAVPVGLVQGLPVECLGEAAGGSQVGVVLGLSAVGDGSASVDASIIRQQGLSGHLLGAAWLVGELDASAVVELLLEAQVLGEAQTDAMLQVQRQLAVQSLGEGAAAAEVARIVGVQVSALGEAALSADQVLRQLLETRVLGEAQTDAVALRLQLLSSSVLGSGQDSGSLTRAQLFGGYSTSESTSLVEATRKRLAEVRALGESIAHTEQTRKQWTEVQVLGEALGSLSFDATIQLLLEAVVHGEALSSMALGLRAALEARAFGESQPSLLLGLVQALEARILGESPSALETTRQRALEGRQQGEAAAQTELMRLRTLEGQALAASHGSGTLGVLQGLEISNCGEAIAAMQLAAFRCLEARTYGEAVVQLLVIENIANRFHIELVVHRPSIHVVAIKTIDGIEVFRASDEVVVQ